MSDQDYPQLAVQEEPRADTDLPEARLEPRPEAAAEAPAAEAPTNIGSESVSDMRLEAAPDAPSVLGSSEPAALAPIEPITESTPIAASPEPAALVTTPFAVDGPVTIEGPASPAALAPTSDGAFSRLWREIVSGVQTLVSAAVYATLIVTFGFQVARVDGLSMAPTLEDHDRLIVNKLVYELGEPRPGDIVMLYYPLNPEKMFVKRVIAKEGDTVRIVDGRVYVNDIPLHDDYVPAEFRSHDDWGPQVIQQGYYFVMGDHRNNSSDSRHWGPVPKKYIVGKVKVRWWPLQDARIF
jgi:signal peptidase I